MVYIDTSLSLCCKTSFTFAAAAQYLLCVPTHTTGRSPTPLEFLKRYFLLTANTTGRPLTSTREKLLVSLNYKTGDNLISF